MPYKQYIPGTIVRSPIYGTCCIIGMVASSEKDAPKCHLYSFHHDIFAIRKMTNLTAISGPEQDLLEKAKHHILKHITPSDDPKAIPIGTMIHNKINGQIFEYIILANRQIRNNKRDYLVAYHPLSQTTHDENWLFSYESEISPIFRNSIHIDPSDRTIKLAKELLLNNVIVPAFVI